MAISGVQTEAIIMAAWIALILGVGIRSKRRVKSTSEFMVGGRTIPVWMLAMWSAGAAVSAWGLLGLPGSVYESGAILDWSICTPIIIGFPIAVIIIGRWMSISGRKYSMTTMPDFLGETYGGNLIRAFSAVGIVIACVFFATAQFRAIGILFSALFGINYTLAASIGIAITLIYVLAGGFVAGSIINTFNVSIMIVAAIIAVVLGYIWTGGYGNMLSVLSAGATGAQYMNVDAALGGTGWYFWVSWALILSSFGLIGQPVVVQKMYGIKKPGSLWIWGLASAIIFGIVCQAYIYLGEVARYLTITGQAPDIVKAFGSPDYVIPWLTVNKLGVEQPILGGILIVGVIAAAWCTIDGLLMMGGAAIAKDVINRCFRPNWSDRQLLLNLRLWMVIVGALMVVETLFPVDIVNWLASIGWAQFAATLAPALILGVLWKGVTKWGGTVGVLVGATVAFVLTVLFRLPQSFLSPFGLGATGFLQAFYLDAGAWGFLAGAASIIVVSLLTKKERGPLYYDIHEIRKETVPTGGEGAGVKT